ncbi:acyltransferase family protein [Fundicoccus culcitae]|uniref:Acyltransferase n=1 Tax=Fundicoccus culcitae TaxID=2969821 RepID=A0ABY5P6G1_9LACT|nr:acyltransferase family protein [Fundicoccus culcitae]UUX34070.1 acyltransferase [Fundicoccus culcitae]
MSKKRILSFDALKGISIIAIIAYHLYPQIVPGGFLMVNTFFVLAGFFVGRKLESIELKDNKINWKAVWRYIKQTVGRIFIPLLWMIMLIVFGLLIFNPRELTYMRTEILASLFLVNNFFQINAERSYFVQMTDASPFTHLWYNSLYIQFFLITIPLVLIMKRLKFSIPFKGIIWSIIILLSHALIILQYVPGEDPTNVYYGLGTRYSSFAIGVGAVYYIPIILNALNRFSFKQFIYRFISIVSFLVTIGLIFMVTDQSPLTYYFWMPLYSIANFLLIFSLTIREPIISWLLSNQLLVMIGQRSYSFYLWYYPIIVFYMGYTREYPLVYLQIASIITIFVMGELFYQLVEQPKFAVAFGQDLNFKDSWRNLKAAISLRQFKPMYLFRSLAVLVLIGFFAFIMIFIANDYVPLAQFDLEYRMRQQMTNVQNLPLPAEQKMISTSSMIAQMDDTLGSYFVNDFETTDRLVELQRQAIEVTRNEAVLSDQIDENRAILDSIDAANPFYSRNLSPKELIFAAQTPVTFFGDSLVYISAPYALDLFQSSNEFGYGSLQIYDATSILVDLINQGVVNDILVINLGTNASLTDEAMVDLIEAAGKRELFFVNTNSAVQHIEEVNSIIADFASRYDNVHEIDWHSYQQGHPEWYTWDEIHHSEEGRDQFAILVARELYKFYN